MASNNACQRVISHIRQTGNSCGVLAAAALIGFQDCIRKGYIAIDEIETNMGNVVKEVYEYLMNPCGFDVCGTQISHLAYIQYVRDKIGNTQNKTSPEQVMGILDHFIPGCAGLITRSYLLVEEEKLFLVYREDHWFAAAIIADEWYYVDALGHDSYSLEYMEDVRARYENKK